jgi:hypothetical protein
VPRAPILAQDFSGCYEVQYDVSAIQTAHDPWALTELPDLIVLERSHPTGWPHLRAFRGRVFSVQGFSSEDIPKNAFIIWTYIGRDSVEISHPLGMKGLSLVLTGEPGSLRGKVILRSDFIPPDVPTEQEGSVIVNGIGCNDLPSTGRT